MKILTVSDSDSVPEWHTELGGAFLATPSGAVEAAGDTDIIVVDMSDVHACRQTVLEIREVRRDCPIIVRYAELLDISAVSWNKELGSVREMILSLASTHFSLAKS